MTRRHRWLVTAGFAALSATLTAGCVHAPTEVLTASAARSEPGAGAPVPSAGWDEHKVGDAVTTGSGSKVTVRRIAVDALAGGERVAGVDIEACAPASRTGATPVGPALFLLQVSDGTSRKPTALAGWRRSQLGNRALAPGDCVSGWIPFRLRASDAPVAALLASSSLVRWKL